MESVYALFSILCSPFSHVTEMMSNIDGILLSFLVMVNGTPVNTGKFKIDNLRGPGQIVDVNVHHAMKCILSMPGLQIGVLVDGLLKMILDPIHLVSFARIKFDSQVDGGNTIVFAIGLKTKKADKYIRIRCRKQKRLEVYAKREYFPGFVSVIGEGVLQEDKSGHRSGTPYRLSQVIDDGLPSHGRADPNNAALSLAYQEPSFVEETMKVAEIPNNATNGDMIKYALVGLTPEHRSPEQILGNTRPPLQSGLITEHGEVDGSLGKSTRASIALSFPGTWNKTVGDDGEMLTCRTAIKKFEKPGSANQEVIPSKREVSSC